MITVLGFSATCTDKKKSSATICKVATELCDAAEKVHWHDQMIVP